MTHKKIFRFLLTLSFLLLLCFPALSLEGARKGLLLWYQTVLPTLLPFMICMNLMVSFGSINLLTAPCYPIARRLFNLSRAGSFVFLSGILCGYPMGAKNCSDFLDNQTLSLPEAQCLYAISSFPSPMFMAGYMMNMTRSGQPPILFLPLWKMLAAIYLPALPIFFIAARYYHVHPRCTPTKPQNPPQKPLSLPHPVCPDKAPDSSFPAPPLSLDEALLSSIEVMVKIGGYIMLFSILALFIQHLPLPGTLPTALLISIAEMTTGIDHASRTFPGLGKVLLIAFSGAFGGLSGTFQVQSVTKNAGLSIRHYLFWKTIHGILAVILLIFLTIRH